MNVFFTADFHLGEDRFEIMRRPFKTAKSHAETIVKNYNELVKPDDLVYVVGDVLYQKADPEVYLPYVGQMNGDKVLIRGNHDKPFSDELFKPYFEEIIPEGDGIEMEIPLDLGGFMYKEDLKCWVTHYPTQSKYDCFNLVGHIHGLWKVQLNMLNVGVDVHHFYPMPIEHVGFYLKAICLYFDEDAWVAYDPINADYREDRGKKSRYFNGG